MLKLYECNFILSVKNILILELNQKEQKYIFFSTELSEIKTV